MPGTTTGQVTINVRRHQLVSAFPGRRPMGFTYSWQLPETRVLQRRDGTQLVQLAGSWIECGTGIDALRGYLKRAYGRGVIITEQRKVARNA
jgi:hypothetical protein